MSAAPALTPLRTTPQKPSIAWPWVTTSILMSFFWTSAPSSVPPVPAPLPDGVAALHAPSTTIAPTSRTAVFRRFILSVSSHIDRAPARPRASWIVHDVSLPGPPDPSGRTRDPVSRRATVPPPFNRTAGPLPSAWDLLESHRSVLMERPGRRLCDAQRGDAIARRARARDLPVRDPDECGEFGGVRRCETIDEVGPRRTGRRWHARFDRAERRARPPADGHAVARAEQLGPDVVAERIVARRSQSDERSVGHAQGRHGRVHVVVLGEDREAPDTPIGIDLLHLAVGQPAQDIEVVDGKVAEYAARLRDVRLVRRRRIVTGEADRVEGPERSGLDQPARLAITRVEAALEAELERDPAALDLVGDGQGVVEIRGQRLRARGR